MNGKLEQFTHLSLMKTPPSEASTDDEADETDGHGRKEFLIYDPAGKKFDLVKEE